MARIDVGVITLNYEERGEGPAFDATVPFYQSEDLHNAMAGSRHVIVEEGSHYSYRRHWQEWNRLVDPFLREHEGRA